MVGLEDDRTFDRGYRNRLAARKRPTRAWSSLGVVLAAIILLSGCQIVTIAGGGSPATTVAVSIPQVPTGNGIDSGGVLYSVDAVNATVNTISNSTDIEATIGGDGTSGFFGDGGPATSAELNSPSAMATSDGGIFVADTGNHRIRVISRTTASQFGISMVTGDIYTLAGDGIAGNSGNGGLGTAAELNTPEGLARDPHGNLLFSDSINDTVYAVARLNSSYYGLTMTKGHIYAIAGDGDAGYSGDGGIASAAELDGPRGLAVDSSGNILIADSGNDAIRVVAATSGSFYGQTMVAGDIYTIAGDGSAGYTGDGGPDSSATLSSPASIVVESSGNLILSDSGNNVIREIPVSSGTYYGIAMTANDIYTIVGDGTAGYSGDGGNATAAELNSPTGLSLSGSPALNVAISDTSNARVRMISYNNVTRFGISMHTDDLYTIAGDGETTASTDTGVSAGSAVLHNPTSVALAGGAGVVISDTGSNDVQLVPHAAGTYFGVPMIAGDIYTIAGDGSAGYSGSGGIATAAELNLPTGLAVDSNGNVVVADTLNNVIRVVANSTGTYYGVSMTAGDIYTVVGDGTSGYSGDGGLATSAELAIPGDVTVDGGGNLVMSDTGNNAIRVVAESTGTFYGISMTDGDIYTIAGDGSAGYAGDGGGATAANLSFPTGLAVDSNGNVVVADTLNNVIRVVANSTGTYYGVSMTAGDIYTVVGDGTSGYSGDGGLATSAELNGPTAVAVDSSDDILLADSDNNVLRVVAGFTGTYDGESATVGDIYTVAGTGAAGFTGDGSTWSTALNDPEGMAVDSSGDIYVADSGNGRVRELSE
jgi:uncharacterized protein YheU (UPF0270 family)